MMPFIVWEILINSKPFIFRRWILFPSSSLRTRNVWVIWNSLFRWSWNPTEWLFHGLKKSIACMRPLDRSRLRSERLFTDFLPFSTVQLVQVWIWLFISWAAYVGTTILFENLRARLFHDNYSRWNITGHILYVVNVYTRQGITCVFHCTSSSSWRIPTVDIR